MDFTWLHLTVRHINFVASRLVKTKLDQTLRIRLSLPIEDFLIHEVFTRKKHAEAEFYIIVQQQQQIALLGVSAMV